MLEKYINRRFSNRKYEIEETELCKYSNYLNGLRGEGDTEEEAMLNFKIKMDRYKNYLLNQLRIVESINYSQKDIKEKRQEMFGTNKIKRHDNK